MTYSANGAQLLLITKASKQVKPARLIRWRWINNCTQHWRLCQSYIAPRLLFATSKRWITGRSKTRSASRMARFAEFLDAPWLQCANNFVPFLLQQTEPMATVHEEIDNWLAADLYGELSAEEQRQLHTHLVDCAVCRKSYQETKTMNKILEETLAQQKPDPAFEQRMLASFRNRVPERIGLLKLLAGLMRMRAAQVTAVAAVFLGLVLLGTMMTRESAAPLRARDRYANRESFEQPSLGARALLPARAGTSDKSDELAAGKRIDVADAAKTRSSPEREFKAYPTT